MANQPTPDRQQARDVAKKRRAKRFERREAYFDLLASGYSYQQIAETMKVTHRSVRRAVDRAVAERRLDSPERYVHLQVARLTKALRLTDMSLDQGDIRAVAPFVRVVAELDRHHGLGFKYQRRLDARVGAEPPTGALPPLALNPRAGRAERDRACESDKATYLPSRLPKFGGNTLKSQDLWTEMRLGFPSAGFGFPSGWLGNPSSQPSGAAEPPIALWRREGRPVWELRFRQSDRK
jgi:hypothetical protein